MDPNAHAKEREQPVHGRRVLFCYGPRQGNRDRIVRLRGDAGHIRLADHRDVGVAPRQPCRGHALDVYVDAIWNSHPSMNAVGVHDVRDIVVPVRGPPEA